MSNSIKAALAVNGTIALTKAVGAFFTGSASMVAEAVHSFADCGNQLLLMWGLKTSTKKATPDHPLGYGKNTYFWSFVVALVLFSIGGAYSVAEGIHKLAEPEPLQYVEWAVGILIFSFFLELKSWFICFKEITSQHPNRSIWWIIKETREPDLLVVLGEDTAALLGLGMAGAFLGIAWLTGNPMWDAIGSICVGTLLMVIATWLFIETKALLIGQSVDPDTRRSLHEFLAETETIEHTYECVTLQMGNDAILLLRVRMREKEDASQLLANINELEQQIRTEFPSFTKIFIEPDTKFKD